MKKCVIIMVLALALLLSGCSVRKQVYQIVYLDVFDTVTTLRGYETSEKVFNDKAAQVHSALLEYHRLFDIYHDFPGGLKAVNDAAGGEPVTVDPKVMALLEDCRDDWVLTGGRVNAAMGSVLSLWHEARQAGLDDPERAALPDEEALREAAKHIDFDGIILDAAAGTVYISDPAQSLDVGAIAKGWAAQQVTALLPEGYLLNLGGNTCARGSKPDGSPWIIGVQHPDSPSDYLCTVAVSDMSAVTSGDYQRSYQVDGVPYHHIIDPDTLMPSTYWRSVTILCPDSALADCLSTALFLMPLEEGKQLALDCGAEALWVDAVGNQYETNGFRAVRKD